MRTPKELYMTDTVVYTCELATCPLCGAPLVDRHYVTGPKTVQSMITVVRIAHRPKHCSTPSCPGYQKTWISAEWQQVAPRYITYGYDVIAQIGWDRQTRREQFAEIHTSLGSRLQICESEVRWLYHQVYLPLLACQERQYQARLEATAAEAGLILALDGLAPEGGEAQLWVVREVQTGLTVRSGWLSKQDEGTFVNFLTPIREAGWRVTAVLSDKERGLVPAVAAVFPKSKHAFCQMHYLKNAAAPIAEADEGMKVTLRKQVRETVGDLIRSEKASQAAGVLTVTGLLPSPVPDRAPNPPESPGGVESGIAPTPAAAEQADREEVVQDITRRVRYLLTLKGRPPLRLAGVEMFEGLTGVVNSVDRILQHAGEPRLLRLRDGLHQALDTVRPDYTIVRQAANWLQGIREILDPEGKPARSGEQVRQELWRRLDQIGEEGGDCPRLQAFSAGIRKVSLSYDPGLFHSYDVPGLPRTNNGRESEFRDLTRRLLTTTGQKGLVRRTIQREGAWELIPRPATLSQAITGLSQVDHDNFLQEQQRVRLHRARFRLHVRSAKQSGAKLERLEGRWIALPPASGP
jgi:hypothetical protein